MLHPDKGWKHLKIDGKIVRGETQDGQELTKPYVSPLAAKQAMESLLNSALNEGYALSTPEDVEAWKERAEAVVDLDQEQRERDWHYVGLKLAQGFEVVDVGHSDVANEAPSPANLLADPRCDHMRELHVRIWLVKSYERSDYRGWFQAMETRVLPALEWLDFDAGDPKQAREARAGRLASALRHPLLRKLTLMGTPKDADLGGVEAPSLEEMKIWSAADELRLDQALKVRAPKLKRLFLDAGWHGDFIEHDQVLPFFQRDDLISLEHLELRGVRLDEDLFARLPPHSPVLRRLKSLTLAGDVPDECGLELARHADAYRHIKLSIPEDAIPDGLRGADFLL